MSPLAGDPVLPPVSADAPMAKASCWHIIAGFQFRFQLASLHSWQVRFASDPVAHVSHARLDVPLVQRRIQLTRLGSNLKPWKGCRYPSRGAPSRCGRRPGTADSSSRFVRNRTDGLGQHRPARTAAGPSLGSNSGSQTRLSWSLFAARPRSRQSQMGRRPRAAGQAAGRPGRGQGKRHNPSGGGFPHPRSAQRTRENGLPRCPSRPRHPA